MYWYEIISWFGAAILMAVIVFYMVFGQVSLKRKHRKVFGIDNVILGNKSAEIPRIVLIYTFGASFTCFLLAFYLSQYGI